VARSFATLQIIDSSTLRNSVLAELHGVFFGFDWPKLSLSATKSGDQPIVHSPPSGNIAEKMSVTQDQNKIDADFPTYNSSFPTTDVSPTGTRSALKRVNTPPGLSLFNLMSSDASALAAKPQSHKRSYSAVGRTVVIDQEALRVSGTCNSAGLTMKPGTSASAMNALQIGMDSMRSPCFVHKTFGGSINLERVLDECRAEEMTPHNLLRTATGVREVARQLGIPSTFDLTDYRSHRNQNKDQKCDDCHKGSGSRTCATYQGYCGMANDDSSTRKAIWCQGPRRCKAGKVETFRRRRTLQRPSYSRREESTQLLDSRDLCLCRYF